MDATGLAFFVAGMVLLIVGAEALVRGAMRLAAAVGISPLVVGLTVVAFGTSSPELAVSVNSALAGEAEIAVGNVVGSNLFNILAVLGASALAAPRGIPVSPAALRFDIPVMIVVAVACLPIFFTGRVIARWEGALFLAYYLAYTTYLILGAAEHAAVAPLGRTLLFVLPLTIITLLILAFREAWRERADRHISAREKS